MNEDYTIKGTEGHSSLYQDQQVNDFATIGERETPERMISCLSYRTLRRPCYRSSRPQAVKAKAPAWRIFNAVGIRVLKARAKQPTICAEFVDIE
jgi:hypothetical protein